VPISGIINGPALGFELMTSHGTLIIGLWLQEALVNASFQY